MTPLPPTPAHEHRPLARLARPRTGVALVALLAVLGATAWFAYDAASRARDVRAEVYAARAELERAQDTVQALAGLDAGHLPGDEEIEAALLQIRAAGTHLRTADARMGYLPTLLPLAGLLPQAQGAAEVPALLDVALTVTDSADALLTAVLPLLQPAAEDSPSPSPLSLPSDSDSPLPTRGEGPGVRAPDSPSDSDSPLPPVILSNVEGRGEGPGVRAPASLAERVRAVFVEDGDALDAALARLEATRPEVERLQARGWGAWLDAAPPALDLLDASLEEVPRAREAFAAIRTGLDPLFGFDRPKTYLVAGLNESELRPTGGFMGTVGIVTVDRGHIVTSEFERVYAFERALEEYRTPPRDLATHMAAGYFQLRDANWWPDFPTSAESTLDLFELNQGFRPDGVIAINTLLTHRLVEVFAPLDLPEYAQPLTAANWRGVMENTLLDGRDELGQVPVAVGTAGAEDVISAEGSYLHPLMEELIARSQTAGADQLVVLFAALAGASAARDLQAYVVDDAGQAMLDQFGVTGRLAPLTDDERAAGLHRVAVVDSNVSWSKVGPGIHRDTTVLVGEGGFVDVIVRWENRADQLDPAVYPRAVVFGQAYDSRDGSFTQDLGLYGNYVRLYLPRDAVVTRWQGTDRPGLLPATGDTDHTLVSARLDIPAGGSGQLVVTYQLPEIPRVLEVWKQGGIEHDTLRILQNIDGAQATLFDGPFTSDVTVPLD